MIFEILGRFLVNTQNIKGYFGVSPFILLDFKIEKADRFRNIPGKQRNHRRTKDRLEEFDPIHEHQFYCPWINGYVAAATGSGESNFMAALCGWQLIADALDASRMQNSTFIAPMESESAASMHKVGV